MLKMRAVSRRSAALCVTYTQSHTAQHSTEPRYGVVRNSDIKYAAARPNGLSSVWYLRVAKARHVPIIIIVIMTNDLKLCMHAFASLCEHNLHAFRALRRST